MRKINNSNYQTAERYLNPIQKKDNNNIYENYLGPKQTPKQTPINNYYPDSMDTKQNNEPVHIKWETKDFANTKDPKVWGPSFWFTLHNGAAEYPIKASPSHKEKMKMFLKGMSVMLPCSKCQIHSSNHIHKICDSGEIDEIVSGRENLFNFFVKFHNYVTRVHGKPEMSEEDARKLYEKGVKISIMSYS